MEAGCILEDEAVCGDGVCAPGEDPSNCPEDCDEDTLDCLLAGCEPGICLDFDACASVVECR